MGISSTDRALLTLGLLGLLRGTCLPEPPTDWSRVREPVSLALDDLSGADFRLLPGVGPVLAERLESARLEAGGRLELSAAEQVSGVGPVLVSRWADLARLQGGPRRRAGPRIKSR